MMQLFFLWQNHHLICTSSRGEHQSALHLSRDCYEHRIVVLGRDHVLTLNSMFQLTTVHHVLGQNKQSLPLHRDCLEHWQKALGMNHKDTLKSMSILARHYDSLGSYQQAISLFQWCWKQRTALLGKFHPDALHLLVRWFGSHTCKWNSTAKHCHCHKIAWIYVMFILGNISRMHPVIVIIIDHHQSHLHRHPVNSFCHQQSILDLMVLVALLIRLYLFAGWSFTSAPSTSSSLFSSIIHDRSFIHIIDVSSTPIHWLLWMPLLITHTAGLFGGQWIMASCHGTDFI